MKKIKLTKDKYAIVDDEDYNYLCRFRLIYSNGVFVTLRNTQNRYSSIPVGNFIVGQKNSYHICHKNKNDLDFRKENLIFLPIGSKTHKGKKRKNKCTSKYKGVHKSSDNKYRKKKWKATIVKDKKIYFIGSFNTEDEAGLAYNKKAKELYGDNAYQNKICNCGCGGEHRDKDAYKIKVKNKLGLKFTNKDLKY